MLNLGSFTALPGLPPELPLVTDTIHTFGWLLVVSLVAGPAIALAGSVLREALSRASGGGRSGRCETTRLCPSGA
jgi:hypothetical protein